MKLNHQRLLLGLTTVCVLFMAGCIRIDQELRHNKDGSGQIVFDMGIDTGFLDMLGGELPDSPVSNADAEKLKAEDANFRNATSEEYTDEKEYRHFKITVEVYDFVKAFDNPDITSGGYTSRLEEISEGTYRYTQIIEGNEPTGQEPEHPEDTSAFESNFWTIRFYAPKILKADPAAKIDRVKGMVVWKFPMSEMTTKTEPTELWVEYSLQGGGLNLPQWAWFAIPVGLLCCGGIVVMAGVVVFLVLRKKK